MVSSDGEYLGGAIAPGPGVTAEALSLKTAKLPSVAMAPPPRVIGKGTVDSIQSGLFFGYLGLIEGVTRRILNELGEATVVATGGLTDAPVVDALARSSACLVAGVADCPCREHFHARGY